MSVLRPAILTEVFCYCCSIPPTNSCHRTLKHVKITEGIGSRDNASNVYSGGAGSNQNQETDFSEYFRSFPQYLQANSGTVLQIRSLQSSLTSSPVYFSLVILPFDIYSLSY
jgi:hypothetical protein